LVERQCAGFLRPDVLLPFDAVEFHGATVCDVLTDPERFVGARLADPIEGVEYRLGKAMVIRCTDGSLWIHRFAHGRTVYERRHDAKSVEAAAKAAPESEIADIFVEHFLAADLEADEEHRLRDVACERTGIGKRSMDAKLKAAREKRAMQLAKAERERRAAECTDPRVKLAAPLPDAELLSISRAIDEVLRASELAEPPTRDLEFGPVEVCARQPFRLHGLSKGDTNPTEYGEPEEWAEKGARLPPPKMWLLKKHDKFSMGYLIEKHIEYFVETKEG
jgi:hypothetical protein